MHPGALETCNNIDDDCDGTVDEGLPIGRLSIVLTPSILWPPNHRLVDVHATVTNLGGCSASSDPVTVVLISVVSSEPDDAAGEGDGHTTNDIQDASLGVADFAFRLRAERTDPGPGRSYAITYRATDASGNSKTATAFVTVPVYRK
jgi:putative metal-binding protein